MQNKLVISVACLAIAAVCGCHKKDESASATPQPQMQQPVTISAFSATLPPALAGKTIAVGGKAWIDTINNKSIDKIANVSSEDRVEVNGWAFDDKTKSVPEMAFIELAPVKGDAKYYAAVNRTDRLDVAKAYNEPAYKKSGYQLKADIRPVPSGEYQINVIQILDGSPVLTPSGKMINKTN